MFSVEFAPPAVGITEVGLKLAEAPAGSPESDSPALPPKPLMLVKATV
jgi:hypothetical protein